MINKNTQSKPLPAAQEPTGEGCSGATCSASWNPPETAPKNETCIIANFGWPWPVVAIWSTVDEEWATAQLSPCSEEEGRAWETEYERGSRLIGWLPLPSLPNVKGDSQSPAKNL